MTQMNNNKLVIFGSGGHFNSIEQFIDRVKFEFVGTFDDNNGSLGSISDGIETISEYGFAFVAIGNDALRERIVNKIKGQVVLINIIAKDAYISESAIFNGGGTFIGSGAYIGPYVTVETGVVVNTKSIIEHNCSVGSFCQIAPAAVICGNVLLNDYVYVGANATIKQGIKIDSGVILGAGTVVIKNIEKQGTYVGIPCKELI